MMTSKKRTGDDPGDNQGSGNTPGHAEALRREQVEHRVRMLQKKALATGDADAFWVGYRTHAFELVESGGLPESRVGLEVLYMLPANFINFYADLFGRALRVDDGSVMHGRSGGLEKAKGAGGMVLGSEVGNQAKGGGKRWKNTPMAVGNEDALKAKEMVDAGLQGLMRDYQLQLSAGSGGKAGGPPKTTQCTGTLEGQVGLNGQVKKCRAFLRPQWKYCPVCGTARGHL